MGVGCFVKSAIELQIVCLLFILNSAGGGGVLQLVISFRPFHTDAEYYYYFVFFRTSFKIHV